jgi:hypothetical protein
MGGNLFRGHFRVSVESSHISVIAGGVTALGEKKVRMKDEGDMRYKKIVSLLMLGAWRRKN